MDANYRSKYKNGIPKLLDEYRTMACTSLGGPNALSTRKTETPQNVKMKRRELSDSIHLKDSIQEINITNSSQRQMLLTHPSCVRSKPFTFVKDSSSVVTYTMLNGEQIPCFEIGGEKRLCLIAVFKNVLNAFGEDELAAASGCLKLHVSTCGNDQLSSLKKAGVLDDRVPNCGLVTQTDAERLVNKLMNLGVASHWSDPASADSFKVFHDCFGECTGLFDPRLYKSEDALCVRCVECQRLFSPPTFVGHSHSTKDDRITHWGFDRKHWRSYLLLSPDQDDNWRIQKQLKEMKAKFDPQSKKRKHVSASFGI